MKEKEGERFFQIKNEIALMQNVLFPSPVHSFLCNHDKPNDRSSIKGKLTTRNQSQATALGGELPPSWESSKFLISLWCLSSSLKLMLIFFYFFFFFHPYNIIFFVGLDYFDLLLRLIRVSVIIRKFGMKSKVFFDISWCNIFNYPKKYHPCKQYPFKKYCSEADTQNS